MKFNFYRTGYSPILNAVKEVSSWMNHFLFIFYFILLTFCHPFYSQVRTWTILWGKSDVRSCPLATFMLVKALQKNVTHALLRYIIQDHHDYIEHNRGRQQGVRILTSYLYLNDVEAGGGTRFTGLNLTVMPKRGRALFWPSVLNEKPDEKDGRTNHQGTVHNPKWSAYLFNNDIDVCVSNFTFPFFLLVQLYLLRRE